MVSAEAKGEGDHGEKHTQGSECHVSELGYFSLRRWSWTMKNQGTMVSFVFQLNALIPSGGQTWIDKSGHKKTN